VVIAEAIAGDEDDFAKLMTRKARSLGMSRTVYRNANGLPNDEQVTTARDQSTLGRAIQDRFPRYYRYFATSAFNWRGSVIRNHNRLIGSVEGVDGIKTGYTRASGFNLVSSMRRGNRHLIGVVLGGRSGGSRDATMRSLLAENLEKAATRRTAVAINERSPADAAIEVAEDETPSRPAKTVQVAAAEPEAAARPAAPVTRSITASAPAAAPQKPEPGPLNSGVIQTQSLATIPGANEPMKPVRVKTVQVKAGPIKLASAGPTQPAPPITNTISARPEVAETSAAVIAKSDRADVIRPEPARNELPPQPANHGTGQGILGVLPASSASPAPAQAMAYAEPARAPAPPQPSAVQQASAPKPVVHSGWIVQVGALESESEARSRLDSARDRARGILGKADSFTETVAKGDKKLYRARFAGLDRDQAEAACKTLRRSDISCITIKN
jgi:D-alanyl-D-alanine carboxypeptidase